LERIVTDCGGPGPASIVECPVQIFWTHVSCGLGEPRTRLLCFAPRLPDPTVGPAAFQTEHIHLGSLAAPGTS